MVKALEEKIEKENWKNKGFQGYMLERNSFVFEKNPAKNKIKIENVVFFNAFISTIGFGLPATHLFND